MILIAWIIWKAGRLIVGDRIDERERQREAPGSRARLACNPALQGAPPPVNRRAPRAPAQALYGSRLHPGPPGHDAAGDRDGALDGRQHSGPHPQRARGGPVLRPSPQDRRRHIVELTAVGRRALERADKAREGLEDEILAPLSAEERKMLNKLVERVLDGMLQETRS